MTFSITRIDATPSSALGGRVDLLVKVKNAGKRAVITDAKALVYLKAPTGDTLFGWAHMLWVPVHIDVARHGGEATFPMTLFVDAAALRKVEQGRAGQKARFGVRLVLTGVLIEGEINEAPTPRVELDGEFVVGAAEWAKEFLPLFGWGSIDLVELQLPALPKHAALAKEADLLERAARDYHMGEYEDAYTDCRKLVESFKNRETDLSLERVIGREEWGRLKAYLSIALHDNSEIPKKIVRADAEVALRLAQTVYLRVASAVTSPDEKG